MLWLKRIHPRLLPARTLAARTVESASLLYDLRHKPHVILSWLKTAARTHVIFIVAVVLLGFGLSAANNAMLKHAISENSFSRLVSGLAGEKSRSQRQRDNIRRLFDSFLWIAGIGAIGTRLLIDLRGSIGHTSRMARSLAQEADAVRESDPSRCLELYRSAVSLTCYPGDETALREKIRNVENELAARTKPNRTTPSNAPAVSSQNPQTVGERYTILGELGRGASGTVYRADDRVLDRSVALKELSMTVADEDTRARSRREAKILARLNHPNIVQVYDLIEHGGRLWIAMELVEGGDLAAMLDKKGRLAHAAVARLGGQMAEALAFAHGRGVIHRDLKPLNVLLVDDETLKITDFGLAKLSEGNVHTVEGMILGSPRYMSPEQADGRPVTERSDIYSLGIMLYHMVSGKPPFDGDVRSVLMQHLRRKSTPLQEAVPDIPPEMADLVMQMLAKDPADRPADMSVVARRLHSSLETVAKKS
jgi:tRNA A-37 threonylcarbamoyl transferase component Bud32